MQMSVTLELDKQARANLPFGPGGTHPPVGRISEGTKIITKDKYERIKEKQASQHRLV
jgi:hypothetical protein